MSMLTCLGTRPGSQACSSSFKVADENAASTWRFCALVRQTSLGSPFSAFWIFQFLIIGTFRLPARQAGTRDAFCRAPPWQQARLHHPHARRPRRPEMPISGEMQTGEVLWICYVYRRISPRGSLASFRREAVSWRGLAHGSCNNCSHMDLRCNPDTRSTSSKASKETRSTACNIGLPLGNHPC